MKFLPFVLPLFALGACASLPNFVRFNPDALQAQVEQMTGMTPAEQCTLYFTVQQFQPDLLPQVQAFIDAQNFTCGRIEH